MNNITFGTPGIQLQFPLVEQSLTKMYSQSCVIKKAWLYISIILKTVPGLKDGNGSAFFIHKYFFPLFNANDAFSHIHTYSPYNISHIVVLWYIYLHASNMKASPLSGLRLTAAQRELKADAAWPTDKWTSPKLYKTRQFRGEYQSARFKHPIAWKNKGIHFNLNENLHFMERWPRSFHDKINMPSKWR